MVSGHTNEMHWPGGPWGPTKAEGPPGGTGVALPPPPPSGVAAGQGHPASDPELGEPHECHHHAPCHHSPALPPHQLIFGGPPAERRRKAFEGAREVIGRRLQGDLALRGAPDQAGGALQSSPANAGALHSTRDHNMMRQHGNGNTGLRNDNAIPQTISDNPPPQCPKQLATLLHMVTWT